MSTQVTKNIIEDLKNLKDQIESLIETLEIMSDEELMESIKRAEKDVEEGKLIEFSQLAKELGLEED